MWPFLYLNIINYNKSANTTLNQPIRMKNFCCIILLLCCAYGANAQVSGGIKGGVNLTNQKWEVKFQGQSGSQKFSGTSFHVGGYLQYGLGGSASLQPELLYNSLKVDLDGTETTLNYVSVPVMFGYGFDDNRLVLQAGPQLGVLLSTDPSELKDEDAYKGIDFSFNFGALVNFNKFNLSVRYALGLTSITGDELEDELESAVGGDVDLSIKNNNLQFSVGYRLFGNN